MFFEKFIAWVTSRLKIDNRRPIDDNPQAQSALLGAVGLASEAGEVLDLHKKWMWHGKPMNREALKHEMGDVIWYFALLCQAWDFNLQDILDANVKKLLARDGENNERYDLRGKTYHVEIVDGDRRLHTGVTYDQIKTLVAPEWFASGLKNGPHMGHPEDLHPATDANDKATAFGAEGHVNG